MGQLPNPDSSSTGVQLLPALLYDDRGEVRVQPPAAADSETGGSSLGRLNLTFCELYAAGGRPSIPPEQLLLVSLQQEFYGIRSERLLLEQLHYNLLFLWIVGLSPDDPIWHPTTFTKNRKRLLNDDVMGRFLRI